MSDLSRLRTYEKLFFSFLKSSDESYTQMAERYLVTGVTGFIGNVVCRLLLDAGHVVVGVDNLNAAYDPKLKEWRLAQLTSLPCFQFHRLDFTDLTAIEQVFENSAGHDAKTPTFAGVLHLGARAGVQPSVDDPLIYLRTNTEGTLNVLELCRRHGVPKFVLASTSSLYGAHNQVPFSEDADTSRPLSPYAATKKAAEALAFTYHHLHKIDVSIVRYFTVYGPAGRPDMSIFRFIRWIAEGVPIALTGDGEQKRDFTYVDDIARGTVAALKPLGFEVINLGGDRLTSMNSAIGQIAKLLGREPIINRRPMHPADVPATWANVDKAKRLLGWTPQISLEEGLRRTVAWYQENRDLAMQLSLGQ
ncbi:MAG TPA: NAD-dependent epimerase/dehydratase family protein [Pirellulales bacterium]|nr:NAD-dependent epimerase/dehydratase family protein [Pirellulales bacterium]